MINRFTYFSRVFHGRNTCSRESGDIIELNVEKRSLILDVPEVVLQRRRDACTAEKQVDERGYVKKFITLIFNYIIIPG